LYLQKRNTNTEWLAKQLARFAGVPVKDVGYAGLKDRNSVSSQWFSLRMPSTADPDWGQLESDELQVLEAVRHRGIGICFQQMQRFAPLARISLP
jgi:tRNA pseudouridine13 synthase